MKRMNKAEYRAAIAALAMSQGDAAEFFGVHPRTSRTWALGQSAIPHAVAKWLRYMQRKKLTPQQIDAALA
jgi:DNA-binding transcriptional regulator YiaG